MIESTQQALAWRGIFPGMSTSGSDLRNRIAETLMPYVIPSVAVPAGLVTSAVSHAVQQVRFLKAARAMRGLRPAACEQAWPGEHRTIEEAVARLRLGDFNPLPLDGYLSTIIGGTSDIVPMYLDTSRTFRGQFFRYPREFHECIIFTRDGIPLSAVMGLHHPKYARPAIVFVHGMFQSKGNDLVRIPALKAFYEWGFNVCVVDQRGFGRSANLSSVPTSGGGLEAHDLIEVVKHLKRYSRITSVGVVGFSLGAGSVLNAAGLRDAGVSEHIDGGVLAVCPALDIDATIKRLQEPPEDAGFVPTFHFMNLVLKRGFRNSELLKWIRKEQNNLPSWIADKELKSFRDFIQLMAWGHLGVGEDREYDDPAELMKVFMRVTNPHRALRRAKVPTLVVAAEDDPLTQLTDEGRGQLEDAARNNPNLTYHITPRGGHCAYSLVDPDWWERLLRVWFSYWATWPDDTMPIFGTRK